MTKSDLRPGDVLLVKGQGWVSTLIQKATGSTYSHAALVLPALGDVLVLQAWTFGIEIVPIARARAEFSGDVDVFRPTFNFKLDQLASGALAMVGRRYDFLGLFRILWLICTGQRRRAAPRRTNRLFCSEYVQKVFKACGVSLTDYCDQVVEPADLGRCTLLSRVGGLK